MKTSKYLAAGLVILFVCLIAQTVYVVKLKKQSEAFEDGPSYYFNSRKFPFSNNLFGNDPLNGNRWDNFYRNLGPSFGINWDIFEEMKKMQAMIDKMLYESMSNARHNGMFLKRNGPFFVPNMDIRDLGNSYMVKIDVPGMDKSKINVEVRGGQLIVSGERRQDTEENTNRSGRLFYERERSFGKFYRSITLPPDAQHKGIKADYKKGVLTIIIPKRKVSVPASAGTRINVL